MEQERTGPAAGRPDGPGGAGGNPAGAATAAAQDAAPTAARLQADLDLCITLLNLQMKWLRDTPAVPFDQLAQAARQQEQVARLKAEIERMLGEPF